MLGAEAGDIAVEEVLGHFPSVVAGGVEDVSVGVHLGTAEEDPGNAVLAGNSNIAVNTDQAIIVIYEGAQNDRGDLLNLRRIQTDLLQSLAAQIHSLALTLYHSHIFRHSHSLALAA